VWNAIAVAIYGALTLNGGITATPTMTVVAQSEIYVFVGWVNSRAFGGSVASVTDSAGDAYSLVFSTGEVQNRTEALYAAGPLTQSTSLNVSATFAGGVTAMGGSVAAIDVVPESGTILIDTSSVQSSGWGGFASVNFSIPHLHDLLLFGVVGMGLAAPFAPGTVEATLDTGRNVTGPYDYDLGYATFSQVASGLTANLSAVLAAPAEWAAMGVALYVPAPTTTVAAGWAPLVAIGDATGVSAVATVRPG
jgi:hypothetical protein